MWPNLQATIITNYNFVDTKRKDCKHPLDKEIFDSIFIIAASVMKARVYQSAVENISSLSEKQQHN